MVFDFEPHLPSLPPYLPPPSPPLHRAPILPPQYSPPPLPPSHRAPILFPQHSPPPLPPSHQALIPHYKIPDGPFYAKSTGGIRKAVDIAIVNDYTHLEKFGNSRGTKRGIAIALITTAVVITAIALFIFFGSSG